MSILQRFRHLFELRVNALRLRTLGMRKKKTEKKAGELLSVGYFNVEIIMPDGAAYHSREFDQLRERAGLP